MRPHRALDADGGKLMRAATPQHRPPACGCHRVLDLARTVAHLAAADRIAAMHLAEALQYRPRA